MTKAQLQRPIRRLIWSLTKPALTTCQVNPLKQTAWWAMQGEYWLTLYPGESRTGGNKQMSKKSKQWRWVASSILGWDFFRTFFVGTKTLALRKLHTVLIQGCGNRLLNCSTGDLVWLKRFTVPHHICSSHSLHPAYPFMLAFWVRNLEGQKGQPELTLQSPKLLIRTSHKTTTILTIEYKTIKG